jgi:MoaA/NifB/PqqE/SkfB family radical SAM enzyme
MSMPPLLLQYYITERCNCRCRFCDIWPKPVSADAELEVVRQRVKQARALGVRFVDFTGGEPLLHPQLPQMLHAARACGLKTTLTTNALLYPQRCVELKGLVDFLHFSIDGATAAVHNRCRGADVFDAVVHSLDLAQSLGERPDLTFTVDGHNLDQLPLLSRQAATLRRMLVVNPVFTHHGHRPLDQEALAYIEGFSHLPYVYVNTAFHRLLRLGGNRITKPRCRVMDSVLVISPDDRLLAPCYHQVQEERPIADLVELCRSPWFRRLRAQQGTFAACAGCTINCYFDPSFHYKLDRFFLDSTMAKMRYVWYKYLWPAGRRPRSAASVFAQPADKP